MSARHILAATATTLALTLAACGNRDAPFAEQASATDPAQAAAPSTPATSAAPEPTTPSTTPPATPTQPPTDALEPAPRTPGDAPSPAGITPDAGSEARARPRSREGRVQADRTARLNVRTMVSIIEGCHSGRESYKSCNSHEELGGPDILGLTIGKRRGDVQISATDNGFRITGHSMSGAKFTVARGPGGDRFKCIEGPMPGDCPADRTWTW